MKTTKKTIKQATGHGFRVIPALEELPVNRKFKNPPATWGAYFLHQDGWYRLFPPTTQTEQ